MKKFFLLTLAMILTAAVVGAEVQIFDGEGQYIMSDFEDHNVAKMRAQRRAEQNAQKKAGVYLKTFSRSVNHELADDEISAVTNTIISVSDVNIKPVPFEVNGEAGIMYKATLKATIDTDGIYAWLKLDDKDKVEIVDINNENTNLLRKNDEEIENLKEQYKTADAAERQKITEEVKRNEGVYSIAILKEYNQTEEFQKKIRELQDSLDRLNEIEEQQEQAIKDCMKKVERNPKDAKAWNELGLAYYEHHDYEKALVAFDRALALEPNNEEFKKNREAAVRKDNDKFKGLG